VLPGGVFLLGRLRQVGVAVAQLWQNTRELGQPQIREQVVGGILALQALAQQLRERLVG